jgi:hypothetical protein
MFIVDYGIDTHHRHHTGTTYLAGQQVSRGRVSRGRGRGSRALRSTGSRLPAASNFIDRYYLTKLPDSRLYITTYIEEISHFPCQWFKSSALSPNRSLHSGGLWTPTPVIDGAMDAHSLADSIKA